MKHFSLVAVLILVSSIPGFSQDFSGASYLEASWMTTRFYGAQRSGYGPNWLYYSSSGAKHSFTGDKYNGIDVEGGWFDCGDHALFGQTQFYSIYMLIKAFAEFPGGYYDFYSPDYSGYEAKGDFNNMSNGTPNGIPDIVDEVNYALDFLIKATPNSSTFIWQKGNGNYDHTQWVTAPHMSTLETTQGGEPRPIFANPADASMPSLAAAALATAARVLTPYYSAQRISTLLQHAKNAYSYANSVTGTIGSATGNFYPAKPRWQDSYIIAATELYETTGEASYLQDAQDKYGNIGDHYYSLNYNNIDDLAFYNLAKATGNSNYEYDLGLLVDRYTNAATGEGGLSTAGDPQWGTLRFPGNQAFVAALYSKMTGINKDKFIYDQVDYILGSNNAKQSFVVGFCDGCSRKAEKPHHRNVYLRNGNPPDNIKNALVIPEQNQKFGALVGGTRTSSSYKAQEKVTDYVVCEVCIDYNAGLVGALGYIVDQLKPSSIVSASSIAGLSIYTTPSQLHVQLPVSGAQISVYNLQGQAIMHSSVQANSFQWNHQVKGVHIIHISAKDWNSTQQVILR